MSSLRHWLERWAWVPIPGLLVAILALRVLDWQTAYESPSLLMLLNLLFSAPAAVLVAILAGRSFLARGTPALMLLGCGALVWGAAGTVGPALLSQGVNVTISIHNLLVWLAALCHLAGAALSVTSGRVVRWRRLSLTAAYTVVAAVVGLVTLLVLAGWTPVFFVQGQGGTPVRQTVLGLAVLLFALAPLLLWIGDQRVPTPFARWYGLALWLLSTGLFGVMIEVVHGGVLSWAGRTAQFLGGAYLLVAAIVSMRETGTWRGALFTALEEARETAREQEERFQSFFELSADLVCIADLAGFFRQINASWSRVLGYSEAELLAKPYLEFVHPDDRHRTVQVVEQQLQRGRTILAFENRYVRRDGGSVWLEWTGQPLVAKGLIFAIARDVTARKAAEAKLTLEVALNQALLELYQRESASQEQLLDFVLEAGLKITASQHAVIGLLDEAESVLTIHRWSLGAMAQCAMPEKPLVYRLEDAGLLRDCVRQRQPLVVNDYAAPHPSKKCLPAGHVPIQRFLAVPIVDRGRVVVLAAVANKDEDYAVSDIDALTLLMNKLGLILSRRWAEASISQLNAALKKRAGELESVNKELESFAYSVSHDLRTPLRHVHGYVELLTEALAGQLSEPAQRYLTNIRRESRAMAQLIDDLLTFSRMGQAEMRERTVALDGLVQACLHSLQVAVSGRRVVWRIAPLPAVLGDPAMLKQVFANLLDNAVKYSRSRDPAEIEVGCAGTEADRLIFFVRDNGVGFDKQYAHKLFGVFQRLHRADEFEGTGIGLANVRRIIARHGGRTWAEGAVDGGAAFYFTLQPSSSPAACGPEPSPAGR